MLWWAECHHVLVNGETGMGWERSVRGRLSGQAFQLGSEVTEPAVQVCVLHACSVLQVGSEVREPAVQVLRSELLADVCLKSLELLKPAVLLFQHNSGVDMFFELR